jgi:hypothetical protein
VEDFPLLAIGFGLAAVAQLGLAGSIAIADVRPARRAALAVNGALLVVYAYAVLVGLPFGLSHAHATTGIELGSGEPVTLAGAVVMAAEVLAIGLIIDRHRPAATAVG